MTSPIETKPISGAVQRKDHEVVGSFLGLLGSVNLLLIAFYLLSIFFSVSGIPSTEGLTVPILFASTLTIVSAAMLVYGSHQIWKARILRGGVVNLAAGAMSIPAYVYFAFFSQPRLLSWLGILGYLLLLPGLISGMISLFLANESG